MTDRTALLRAITGAGLTDPDAIRAARADDTPRLMYADLIQDEGESERAEFIRVQVELARRWPEAVPRNAITVDSFPPARRHEFPEFNELCRREREIKGDGKTLWREAFALRELFGMSTGNLDGCHDGGDEEVTWGWSRGFVSRLTCSWDDWRDHAARITAEHPIERVRLSTWPNHGPLTEDEVRDDLKMRWPGIAFELPPANFWAGLYEVAWAGEEISQGDLIVLDSDGRARLAGNNRPIGVVTAIRQDPGTVTFVNLINRSSPTTGSE